METMRTKISFNVDKLRLCYRQPDGLLDWLANCRTNDYLQRDSYKLHIVDDGLSESERDDVSPQHIIANVILDDSRLLGTFQFNFSMKYKGLCFFDFDNKALYEKESFGEGEKHNILPYIDYVTDDLGLTINSLTRLELACDVNNNVLSRIRRMVKDFQTYDMFVNGRKIENEKLRIEGLGEYFERSRLKLFRYPTIYVNQAKNQSPLLRIYNKTDEIGSSSKSYITEWNEFGKKPIYRIEVCVNWQDFQKWLLHVHGEGYPDAWNELSLINIMLNTKTYKQYLWEFFANRLLYFREKGSHRDMISMLDIAIGSEAA